MSDVVTLAWKPAPDRAQDAESSGKIPAILLIRPLGYLRPDNPQIFGLAEAKCMARAHRRWLVSGFTLASASRRLIARGLSDNFHILEGPADIAAADLCLADAFHALQALANGEPSPTPNKACGLD